MLLFYKCLPNIAKIRAHYESGIAKFNQSDASGKDRRRNLPGTK
ncbi:hypothetical protein XCR1_1560052 [Xenorhabdus cabanillasii JM26]|uniref:Uncharacterized protein n=1 Tax=Xenorhabdus cabanillasii JM26 TaxID=1427517 RepID=W1IR96_9GAMM|nr:hypothetical protein XCR1_1560052 [Xenorhabdus cabanillasii JM26]